MNTLTLESPYRLVGATLVANGYSVIPIAPGEKRPDPCLGTEWPRYCSRLPTKLEIENWSARPVGVGVALGAASRGLVAIDIDSNEVDVIEAIESRWPSTVRKVGRKGYSAFYWASPAVKSRAFKSGTHGGVDFLAHGRQTILPPTRHKDTGEAYRWLTPRTLENTVIDELPMLPDDIAAQLAEALEPFDLKRRRNVGRSCVSRLAPATAFGTTSRPPRSRTLIAGSEISALAPDERAHRGVAWPYGGMARTTTSASTRTGSRTTATARRATTPSKSP